MTVSKPTISSLINRTGKNDKDIADNAGINITTLYFIKTGKKVKEKTIWKLLNVLNKELGTNYDISEIDGLTY